MHINKIINDYNNGIGTNELSLKYKVHRSTIQRILKKNNIKLRKKSPKYSYNIKFFSKYTHESCYWAGFILADGCIKRNRNTISIKLSINDINHLYKFKEIIDYNGNIHINNDSTYAYIDISGEWFKNDLISKFDITPEKTKYITYSSKIPNKYHSSFIRGIFDGDGSVTYYRNTSNKRKLTISILGTYNLLDNISKIFHSEININKRTKNKLPKVSKRTGTYSITYAHVNSNSILNWIYSTKSTNTYLERKYKRWKEIYNE